MRKAASEVPVLFVQLIELLAPHKVSPRFQESFVPLAERLPVRDWAQGLVGHHIRVQHGKPPNGKAPWFERFDDGCCIIRPRYARTTGGRHDEEYLHTYRTASLWSFARDLKMVT